MNVAYPSALSALAGSTLGGMATIATTWLNQHWDCLKIEGQTAIAIGGDASLAG